MRSSLGNPCGPAVLLLLLLPLFRLPLHSHAPSAAPLLATSPARALQMKEEEEKKMGEVKVVDGVKRVVDKLLGRRKLKRGYEYEVQWKGETATSWLTRDRLEEMGFQKMLTDLDMKVRAVLSWRVVVVAVAGGAGGEVT